jgi:hypothetical protein
MCVFFRGHVASFAKVDFYTFICAFYCTTACFLVTNPFTYDD